MDARATAFVVRRELRRRAGAYVGLAVVIALGGGSATGAMIAAHRTDRAYPGYVRSAEVVDLVVNPSRSTTAMNHAMRSLPGVRTVHSDWLLSASVSTTHAAPIAEILDSDPTLQVRGSTDGRYVDVDRPVITEGRFASGHREVFVSVDYRSALEAVEGRRLHVGDVIDMAFWWSFIADAGIPLDQVVAPIGTEHLRIAGFGHLADEVLPDELYPRQRLVVSADIARRYSCLVTLRADMTDAQARSAAFPKDCAGQYQYYALQVAPGRTSRSSVRAGFEAAANRLTGALPPAVMKAGGGYYYVASDRGDVDHAVHQVTRPTVAALVVFGVVAGLATLTVTGLVVARILRIDGGRRATLRALGATRSQRALIAACPCLVAVLAGLVASALVALASSVVGPVGSVRVLTPVATWVLPPSVVVPSVVVLGALAVAVIATLAWATGQRAGRPSALVSRRSRLWASVAGKARPAAFQGLSAALSSRNSDGGLAVVAGCIVSVVALVAAVVFGSNLASLVRDPDRYGWPWDVTVITDAGYGNTRPDHVAATLDRDPAVEDYGLFAFDSSTTISGRPVPAIYALTGTGPTPLPLVAGRYATVPGEVVLGATTARDLGAHVGDRVKVQSPLGALPVELVGIAALPSLGAFLADRTGLGAGAYLPIHFDPKSADPADQYPAALTAIRLRPGADAASFLRRIKPSLPGWDARGAPPTSVRTRPVRPPAIVNADTMRAAPLALGAILGLGLVVGLTLSIGVSVRDRRRQLAILRALGFSRRDVHATVIWQALAIVAVGLIAGIPLGVVAGRAAWRTFADQLGVAPNADIPVAGLVAVAVGAVLLGVLAALPPARNAGRIAPHEVLRDAA